MRIDQSAQLGSVFGTIAILTPIASATVEIVAKL
jgi:hypothetical protein